MQIYRIHHFSVAVLIALTLAGVVATHGADVKSDALSASPWLWKSFVQSKVANTIDQPKAYELRFAKDGGLSVKADCNRASGNFKVNGGELSIAIGPSTTALCPSPSRSEQFLLLLSTAEKFETFRDTLIIFLKGGDSLVLSAPSIVDRCGDKVLTPRSRIDSVDRKFSAELDKKLVEFVTPGPLAAAGVSLLVATAKGSYYKAAGVSDASKCSLLRADSPYQIGSNTKMMTAAIIYQLQEEGKISTADKISRYLPELSSKLVNGSEITIEMLLTHTSGLLDYFDINNGDGGIAAGVSNKSILVKGYRPEELVTLVADSGKSNFKPGEAGKWKYSNTGYILLGMIIEKVTKRSYESNLRNRIFKPLGLKRTYLQLGQPAIGALPTAYYEPPFVFTTNEWNASQGWSAGAVVSTSQEFAVFLKALFTGKLFRRKETLVSMRSNPPAGVGALGEGTIYGHGMMSNKGILGHGGQTLGFQSDGGFSPEDDFTIVIWSNSGANKVNRQAVLELANLAKGKY
ncbi:MAG: serine hydrolase [Pyrinomonadaceae bacterium]|nr:serine hydrolase [Pyrinomonadaceae bacterium]